MDELCNSFQCFLKPLFRTLPVRTMVMAVVIAAVIIIMTAMRHDRHHNAGSWHNDTGGRGDHCRVRRPVIITPVQPQQHGGGQQHSCCFHDQTSAGGLEKHSVQPFNSLIISHRAGGPQQNSHLIDTTATSAEEQSANLAAAPASGRMKAAELGSRMKPGNTFCSTARKCPEQDA